MPRFKPSPEPAQPLFRTAMGKGFRLNIALGLPLQSIIPNSRSGAEAFFNIARFQNAPRIMRTLGP